MTIYRDKQEVDQLEKRKGGYFYITIPREFVDQFETKRHTRFICIIDENLEFRCGLNHLGDGNYFVIISTKNLKLLNKKIGDLISVQLKKDPNPLGVEIPESIEILLAQDTLLQEKFEKLNDGKKRSVIHAIAKIKDLDKQIHKSIELINSMS